MIVTSVEEITAAPAGSTVRLAADITLSDILVIDKSIILDGNNFKLTSSAGRAINVSGADGVTVKNLEIDCSGERAINIIQKATDVIIDNVTATAANYTVNVATSAPEAVVTIKNSELTGLNVVNIASAGAVITVTDCIINCNDNNECESYAALCLGQDATNGTITATGCTINITEGSDSYKGQNSAQGGKVTIDGSTDGVRVNVAIIIFGDYYYGFFSLESAIESEYASGNTIMLTQDVTLSSGITIVKDKTITLDLNGYTLSCESTQTGANFNMIDVRGTLTVQNGTITTEHVGDNMGWNNSTNIFNVTDGGVLNVKKAVCKNLGGSDMNFVAHLNNWGEVTLNVEDSELESPYVAVRVFNSGNDNNNVTIKNTVLTGGRCIWVHNYTLEDFGTQAKVDAHKALLKFNDIFNDGNSFNYTNAAVRLGFTNSLNYDGNGDQIE